MNLYHVTVPLYVKGLNNMLGWMSKAEAFATMKKFDANTLLQSRLAPDMLPLVRQFQNSTDAAKLAVVRLTGKEAPKNPDTETTFDELRTRIQAVLAWLSSVTESDFNGAEKRAVELAFLPGKYQDGIDYAFAQGIPNFYFHMNMTYALLRHAGVDLGKMDYIGGLNLKDKTEAAGAQA